MGFGPDFIEHATVQQKDAPKKKFGDILEEKKFGDILENKAIPQMFRKRLPIWEAELLLEGKAIRRSFRRRIKALGKKLSMVSRDEQTKITKRMDLMHSIRAIHPGKLIRLIKVAALLRNIRHKPEFLINAAGLHITHRRYGRKPIENAKKYIQRKMKN